MASGNNEVSFSDLIKGYQKVQDNLTQKVKELGTKGACSINPASFMLLQFQMAQLTQVGDSVSNIISQMNSFINVTVRNQKTQ